MHVAWLTTLAALVAQTVQLPTNDSSPPADRPATLAQAETPLELDNGTRFVVPRGWHYRQVGKGAILCAPEGDSCVTVVDGGNDNVGDAIAKAWSVYRPGFEAKVTPVAAAARSGWDTAWQYRYADPGGASRRLSALALGKNGHWTVVIRDIADDVAERRGAQLEVIYNSMAAAGFERETFAGRPARRLDESRIGQLVELIELARQDFGVPGVALGLIEDGRTVFAGGFGVRDLGKPDPVDADTLFNIASNGKALTTLMLAKLVEAKRLDWDTPVASVWPAFRLGDPATTRRTQVRHLICACTGMPRQDYEWLFEGDSSSADAMMQLLFNTQPTSDFGETYQYSNLMAAAAGFLGGRVLYPQQELGAAYDAAMQALVFEPLGMTATTADFDRAFAGNFAAGHAADIDGNERVASQGLNLAAVSTRPSGNHWSNVRDLLRYLRMELDKGRLPGGERYIREDLLLARSEPQVVEGYNEYYGMGLKIDRQWGVNVIHHGGSASGYRSDMIWLPDHGVGAVLLTNSDSGSILRAAFRRRLLEVLFDGEPTAVDSMRAYLPRARAAASARRGRLVAPADEAAVSGLARRYASTALGTLDVRQEDGATWFDFGGWQSEVASQRGEDGDVTFVTISPGTDGFEFVVANRDGRRRLVTRDAQHEYEFSEAAP